LQWQVIQSSRRGCDGVQEKAVKMKSIPEIVFNISIDKDSVDVKG
jgi:hypothetical protein